MGPAGPDPNHPWSDFTAWPQLGLLARPSRGCIPPRLPSPGLSLLHLPSPASEPPQHRSGPGWEFAGGCPQPALLLHRGWWDEPRPVRPCCAALHGHPPGPRPPSRPGMAGSYGEGRARLSSQMSGAMPRGGHSEVCLEKVPSGLSTTFSARRVISTGTGCLERSRSFTPRDSQNLTRP